MEVDHKGTAYIKKSDVSKSVGVTLQLCLALVQNKATTFLRSSLRENNS